MNTKELLQQLHQETAKALLERIQSGEASSADFAAAAKFLKDNDITVPPETDSQLDSLRDKLKKNKERLTQEEKGEISNVVSLQSRVNQ